MAAKKKQKTQVPEELSRLRFTKTDTEICIKACLILKHSHESSQALLAAYRLARFARMLLKDKNRETESYNIRGMSTDEEQDLLRSMLVTAASGLDAMTKQLIRDTLPKLIQIDTDALLGLEKFVRKKIKGEIEDESYEGSTFLARILVATSIQKQLIEDYINYLTKGSLQSSEELVKITEALALPQGEVNIDHRTLKPIFEARNKIIHELDINLDADRRNRNVRSEGKMKNYTNILIGLAERILHAVDQKIKKIT